MVETLRDELRALLGPAGSVDLAHGALTIARIGHPNLDLAPWLARIDTLAATLRPAIHTDASQTDRARALVGSLGALGFRGNQDDYYDPRNSFLNDVLSRRLGIPISLSLLAIELGRRLDVPLIGVAFPGHFLVRPAESDPPLHLDPFHGGIAVDQGTLLHRLRQLARQAGRAAPEFTTIPAEFLQSASPVTILSRMLRNLVRIYVERAEDARALAAVDLLLVLTPDGVNEVRTRGLLYERLGCAAAAAADFHRYLELAPAAPDAPAIELRASKLTDCAPTLH